MTRIRIEDVVGTVVDIAIEALAALIGELVVLACALFVHLMTRGEP